MRKVRPENLAAYLDANRGMQQRIAKALNVTMPTISQWKTGKRPVPSEHINTICEILGVKESDLCDSFLPVFPDTLETRMILKILPLLSDDALKRVLQTALTESLLAKQSLSGS